MKKLLITALSVIAFSGSTFASSSVTSIDQAKEVAGSAFDQFAQFLQEKHKEEVAQKDAKIIELEGKTGRFQHELERTKEEHQTEIEALRVELKKTNEQIKCAEDSYGFHVEEMRGLRDRLLGEEQKTELARKCLESALEALRGSSSASGGTAGPSTWPTFTYPNQQYFISKPSFWSQASRSI